MATETIQAPVVLTVPTLDDDLEQVFNSQPQSTQTLLFANQILRNQLIFLKLINQIMEKQTTMTAQIDALTAEVAQDVTVMNAASSALDACQAALTAAQTALANAPTLSTADVQALTDATNKLEAARTSLAAAVAKDAPPASQPASGDTTTATAAPTDTPTPSPTSAPAQASTT